MIPRFSESVDVDSFRDSRDILIFLILIPLGRLKISEPHPEEPPVRNRPKRVDGSVYTSVNNKTISTKLTCHLRAVKQRVVQGRGACSKISGKPSWITP